MFCIWGALHNASHDIVFAYMDPPWGGHPVSIPYPTLFPASLTADQKITGYALVAARQAQLRPCQPMASVQPLLRQDTAPPPRPAR